MNPDAPFSPRRALMWRILLAPVLVAAMVGVFLYDLHRREAFALRIVIGLVSAVSWLEFGSMCAKRGHRPARFAGLGVLLASPFLWSGVEGGAWLPFLLSNSWLLFLLYVLTKFVIRNSAFPAESLGLTLAGVAFVSLLGMAIIPPDPVRALSPDGTWLPASYYLFLFSCGKGSDIAAFVVGKTFGRTKFAPVISPHKTWEGAVAGAAAGTAAGTALLLLSPLRHAYAAVPWPVLLLFSLSVTIASQVGDLVKSAFKRWAGVKDSGRLLPSFGGMLDMADSFFLSVPVAHVASGFLVLLFR